MADLRFMSVVAKSRMPLDERFWLMVDKPGVTTLEDLVALQACVAETGRLFSICFSERFIVPAVELAAQLVARGEIGRVVQTTGFGPHRLLGHIPREPWTYDAAQHGGILNDLASHQIDQFLYFTSSASAEIVQSQVGNLHFRQFPLFEDFGDLNGSRSENHREQCG